MKKVLLILFAMLMIPSWSLAKEYKDNTYNFQLDLPAKWLIEEDNRYAGVIKATEKPPVMIFIKTIQFRENKIDFNTEPDERLTEKLVPVYVQKIKEEMPTADIQSAKLLSLKYNKGIVVSYLVKDSTGKTNQGVDAYFVIKDSGYSFYMLCEPEDSKTVIPQFLEMLNTFKQIWLFAISDGIATAYVDSDRYKLIRSEDGEYIDCWVKLVFADKTRVDHFIFEKEDLSYIISESYIYNKKGELVNHYRNPSNERKNAVPGSTVEHLLRTIKQLIDAK